MTTKEHLTTILGTRSRLYGVVAIYGIAIALISLVIPLAVQNLVNIVSFGNLLQPLIILTIVVFISLAIVSVFRVFQATVVETIQQKLFVKVGLNLADQLPSTESDYFDKANAPQTVNYFFEIYTIQKAFATLLVSGLEIVFMGFFSLLLIAFYHPLLLVFDIFLILSLLLVIWLPYRKALSYALAECQEKHELAGWLEQIMNNVLLFKMQGNTEQAFNVADDLLCRYLVARKKHFSYILQHLIGLNGIYVLANSLLLGMGGYLVIIEQLSLGQLVAAEIVVNSLLYNFLRIGGYLEDLYDMLASSDKLGGLLTLPQESTQAPVAHEKAEIKPLLSIECENISYHSATSNLFEQFNFSLATLEKVALLGEKGSGKSIIIDLLVGLRMPSAGMVKVNNIPLRHYDIVELRTQIALVRDIELLYASLQSNLVMHRKTISIDNIYRVLAQLNLTDTINQLEQGLDTFVCGAGFDLTKPEVYKIMLARAILAEPSLLILDGVLDVIHADELIPIIDYVKSLPCALLVATNKSEVAEHMQRVVQL